MIRELREEECQEAMEKGEFNASLVSGPASAIILTQSWCPQWTAMKAYLEDIEKAAPEVNIYYVEYDIAVWNRLENHAFMAFKENNYHNQEIPYVRYYRNGGFSRDSNFISAEGFKSRLGLSQSANPAASPNRSSGGASLFL
jgi:hypothetical protein